MVPYPPHAAPSQRFRFEFFIDSLKKSSQVNFASFYSATDYKKLRSKPSPMLAAWFLIKGFLKRIIHSFKALNADFIFVHREVTPAGPPFFEFILAKIFQKKIIYDFDDAIWLPDPHESGFRQKFKWKSKIKYLCRWSSKISCGNDYLAAFASQYNHEVYIIPTVVDTSVHAPKARSEKNDPPQLVWTGSSTTLIYLEQLFPILEKLSKVRDFTLLVMADKPPQVQPDFLTFIPWSMENETNVLARADIGIMPLPDDPWTKGKCGFKLIQYGAVGLPSVASRVGVNEQVIIHGTSGFLCENEKDWIHYTTMLLEETEKRKRMGESARKHIEANYSKLAIEDSFMQLFE